jgi:hypothetical protein
LPPDELTIFHLHPHQQKLSSTTIQLFSATFLLVSAFAGLSANAVDAEEPSSLAYFTLKAPEGGCIGLKVGFDGVATRPFLRPCMTNDDSILWTIDEENRFRSKADYSKCMQAGVKDSAVESGTVLRMVTCGVSDLQKFNLTDFVGEDGLFGQIKPESSSDLCMVHRGPNANIDNDAIVLKLCANLTLIDGDVRGMGWEGEFPEENEQDSFFFTLEAPGGGCMGLKNGSTQRGNAVFLRTCATDDISLLWTLMRNLDSAARLISPCACKLGAQRLCRVFELPFVLCPVEFLTFRSLIFLNL